MFKHILMINLITLILLFLEENSLKTLFCGAKILSKAVKKTLESIGFYFFDGIFYRRKI